MRTSIGAALVLAAAVASGAPALADAKYDQKIQVQLAGAAGKVANFLGGKAMREGQVHTVAIKGDRRLDRTGTGGEIVDLAEEKVYGLDYARKTYTVATFDELRRRAQARPEEKPEKAEKEKPPEYEVDFDVKETGKRETILGYDCREVVITVVVRRKGMKLEEGGGAVTTMDEWLGPKIAALAENEAFEARYAKKLALAAGLDVKAMASAFAANPALAEAMKRFRDKRVDLTGSPVRTALTLESVPDPRQTAEARKEEERTPTSVGGLLGKLAGGKKSPPGARTKVMTTTTELVSVAAAATAADVSIPDGFKRIAP
ncbi:hypothetical protein LLG88_14920 [bacterium]|nr:hypothetical protein [bacterium]